MKPASFEICLTVFMVCSAASAQLQSADQMLAHARQAFFEQGAKAVLPEFERALSLYRQAGDRHGEAIATGYIGYSYYDLGDYSKALDYLKRALRMKERLGDRKEQGKTLGHLGLVYWGMGNYDQAIREHTRSLAIARQIADRQMEGAALNNLGLVHDELGDYRHSKQEYQQALALHRATGFARAEGETLGNIGGVYLLLGRYGEALDYYQQALAMDERLKLAPNIGKDLGNLALCHLGLGQVQEALAAIDRALVLARETGEKKEEADWHKAKGSALLRSGKYDAALAEYRLALEVYEKGGFQRELVEGLQDLGKLHGLLGDAASAEKEFRRGMEVAEKIGHPRGVTTSLLALGDLEWRRKRYAQASTFYEDALARARKSGNHEHTISSLIQLALTYKEQAKNDDALRAARQALEMARTGGLRPFETEALYALGEAERSSRLFSEALQHDSAGQALARTIGDPELGWRLAYARGQVLEALERPQEAVRAYQEAATVIESVRSELREERFRAGYIEDKYQVYVSLVRLLLRLGRINDAFGFAEKMRGRGYSALLSHSAPRTHSSVERELRERIQKLQHEIDQENARAFPERRARKLGVFSDSLADAERAYQNLLDDLRSGDPEYAAARTAAMPSVEELERKLPDGTALVEYVSTDESVAIFVLTNHRLQATTVPLRAVDLRAKVELMRDLLSREGAPEWRKPAESLRQSLIAPIERAGWLDKIGRLYVVPHGPLHYLPFAALPRTTGREVRYLMQDYVVAYLPAAAVLVRRATSEPPRSLFAMAPARTRLTYAKEEARTVGEFYPKLSEVLVGNEATESSFKRNAGSYRILHLATHGYFNKLNPLLSAVELEPDEHEDGRLEVHEILDLRLKAGLVTLSACDTALGSGYFAEVPAGDDFVSLTRAFLFAGSTAVLATLWEVNDHSTLELMRAFYEALARSGNAESLAMAQRAAVERGTRYSHPYFWAPFVLVGAMQ